MMALTSNGVIAIPDFKKISQIVPRFSGGHTNIYRQHGDLTSLLFFFNGMKLP
jgi:hypothetical protein